MLDDLMQEVQTIADSYAFIRAIADLDRTDNALRLRLVIDETMFIQVYANSKKERAEVEPLTGEEIRAMREQAHMSQAVFAHYLNLTAGYVSQLERGAKRPTGAALALLNVIRRKGIDTIL
ncbi:MAG: helix-turn-helix domain-containing protein [Syntrophobacteraceae bacterium]